MKIALESDQYYRFYADGGSYRYTFNGKEKENEIASGDLDFGARIYDARLGRWLSVDPEFQLYPDNSPFCYAADIPILIVDKGGRYLTDPNGNIIYTVQEGQPKWSEDISEYAGKGFTRVGQKVWIYANDGTKHEAIMYTVYKDGVDVTDTYYQNAYDCHGQSQVQGKFFIDSENQQDKYDPVEGMMKADRGGTMKEFTGESNAKAGDILIFRDEFGNISHTAVYNGNGTYTSKNGGYLREKSNYTLDDLKKIYGNNTSYTNPVANKKLESISGSAPDKKGRVAYSMNSVNYEFNKQKQFDKQRELAKQKEINAIKNRIVPGARIPSAQPGATPKSPYLLNNPGDMKP